MRVLLAGLLLCLAAVAPPAAPAAALEPPDDALPLARQIDILAPLGARDELTARALRSYGFKAARQARVYEADAILRPLAEAGDREALYAYVAMQAAQHLPYDQAAEADRLLKRAADRGDLRASALYAWRQLTGENDRYFDRDWLEANPDLIDPMIARLRTAAESGDPHGTAYWGAFQFVESAIVSRSHDLGERLLREAAAANVAFAHRFLASLYHGKIITFFQDEEATRRHYRAAFELSGDPVAFYWALFFTLYPSADDPEDPLYREGVRLGLRGLLEIGSTALYWSHLQRLTEADRRAALRVLLQRAVFGGDARARLYLAGFYWGQVRSFDDLDPALYRRDLARRTAWLLLADDPLPIPVARRLAPEEIPPGSTALAVRTARVLEDLREDLAREVDPAALEAALAEGVALADAFRRGEREPLLEPLTALLAGKRPGGDSRMMSAKLLSISPGSQGALNLIA